MRYYVIVIPSWPVATEERLRLRITRVSTVSRERERVKRSIRRIRKIALTRFDLYIRIYWSNAKNKFGSPTVIIGLRRILKLHHLVTHPGVARTRSRRPANFEECLCLCCTRATGFDTVRIHSGCSEFWQRGSSVKYRESTVERIRRSLPRSLWLSSVE